jgi:hypothetical protein
LRRLAIGDANNVEGHLRRVVGETNQQTPEQKQRREQDEQAAIAHAERLDREAEIMQQKLRSLENR